MTAEVFGLTPDQESFLSRHTIITLEFRFDGDVDASILSRVLQDLTERHTALRLRIVLVDGVLGQAFVPSRELPFDVERVGTDELGDAIERWKSRVVDLDRGPADGRFFALEPCGGVLVIRIHHVAADRYSAGALGREIIARYESYLTGDQTPERDHPDYLGYLRRQVPVLSTSFPMPLTASKVLHSEETGPDELFDLVPAPKLAIRGDVFAGFQRFCAETHTTPAAALLSAILLALHDVFSHDELEIVWLDSGRSVRGDREIIGCLARERPLRFSVNTRESLHSHNKRVMAFTLREMRRETSSAKDEFGRPVVGSDAVQVNIRNVGGQNDGGQRSSQLSIGTNFVFQIRRLKVRVVGTMLPSNLPGHRPPLGIEAVISSAQVSFNLWSLPGTSEAAKIDAVHRALEKVIACFHLSNLDTVLAELSE